MKFGRKYLGETNALHRMEEDKRCKKTHGENKETQSTAVDLFPEHMHPVNIGDTESHSGP